MCTIHSNYTYCRNKGSCVQKMISIKAYYGRDVCKRLFADLVVIFFVVDYIVTHFIIFTKNKITDIKRLNYIMPYQRGVSFALV